jgi:hypothetical protein
MKLVVKIWMIIFLWVAVMGCSRHINMLDYNKSSRILSYNLNDTALLRRKYILVKTEAGKTDTFLIKLEGNILRADLGAYGHYSEELTIKNFTTLTGKVNVEVKTNEPFIIQCPFYFSKTVESPYFMIPGFLYGTNNIKTSKGQQPKLDYGGRMDWPNSSLFYCRADRSTHPGVLTVKNNAVIMVGINEKVDSIEFNPENSWAPGYLYNGLMLDTSHPEVDIIGFQIGYENAPKRYSWEEIDPVIPSKDEFLFGWIAGLRGRVLKASTFYYLDRATDILDYGKAITSYYEIIHQPPVKRSTRSDALEKIAHAIVKYSWNEENKYFSMTDGVGKTTTMSERGTIAWTGGMQTAYPLLKASMKINYAEGIITATAFIDNLCSGKLLNQKAGLLFEEFYQGKWNISGWWGNSLQPYFGDNPLHSAYLNGQAAYYLLKSYELTGRQYDGWFSTARIILQTALKGQDNRGAYPSLFDPENGKGLDYNGFQSCWFVPGMALMFKFTGDSIYLRSAEKAIDYYHQFHLKGEVFGTPMDTYNAVDQEGNLSFIIAGVELHKLTKNEKYLNYGLDGLNWEFSWKFAYNTAHTNQPLKSLNWSSCGGSVTSTHNPAIHTMGNLVAGEIYYLYKETRDLYIADRLKDVCVWGLGCYNTYDHEFGFGKKGQGTEAFYYSDGLVIPWWKAWDGGIWEESLAWSLACLLLSCAEDIPDDFYGN